MGAQALKRVVDAVQARLSKTSSQRPASGAHSCVQALLFRAASRLPFCSVDCPVYDIAGRNRFRTKLSDADLRLAFADCKGSAIRRCGICPFFESRYKIMYCPRETPMP